MYLLATPATGASVVPAPSRRRAANTAADTAARPSAGRARVRHRRARLWLRQEASREWEGRLVQRRGQPGGDVAGQPGEEAVRPLPRHRPAQVLQLPRRRGMEGEELQHLQVRASGIRPDQGRRLHGRLRGEGRRGEVRGLLEQPGQEAGTDSVREVRREKFIYYRNADWR